MIFRAATDYADPKSGLRSNEGEPDQHAREPDAESARPVAAHAVANVGSWETDLATLVVAWSDETHRIFETDPASFQFTHQRFLEIVHPGDRVAVDEAFARSFGEPGAAAIEHRLLMPDGRVKFVDQRWQVFHDGEGRAVRAFGTCLDITERKHADDEARRLADRLKATLESITDPFVTVDRDWRFTFVNHEAELVLGRTRADLTGRNIWTEFPAMIGSSFEREYRRAMADNQTATFEEFFAPLDIWFSVHAYPSAEGLAVHFRDITERVRTANALRESNEKFQQLAENVSDAFWVRSPDMHELHYVSPAYERIWGRPAASLHGDPKQWSDLIVPEDRERVMAAFDTLKSDAPNIDVEYHIVRPDGEIRWVRVRGFQVRDATGQLIRLTGIVTDMTERRLAAEALRVSMEEFRTLAEAVPQIVWISGPDGANMYFNQQWMGYTGLTRDESLSEGWSKATHPDDQQRALRAWLHATVTLGTYSLECRLRRADGVYRWWLIRGVPQLDASGKILKWFGTCTDIDDLKQAELEISRTNRALKMMSSCNETLIRAEFERDLLHEICAIAVEIGGYRMAWVGYAQDDADKTIAPQADAGAEDGYLSEVTITWNENEPFGQGPAGRAIRSGRAMVAGDLAQDSTFGNWAAPARRHGYRGIICLPLRDTTRTFGVLALYSAEPSQTSAEELKLLQEMADNLAFGIGNLRAQSEQRRMQAAVVTMAASVSAASGTEFFEQLARNMAEAVGAQAGFVAQLLPGDPVTAHTIAAVVEGVVMENFDYEVAGTPCEDLLHSDTCVIAKEVGERYPRFPPLAGLGAEGYVGRRLHSSSGQPLGLLFVVFREPLKRVEFITSTLQIFAARAASELERQRTDAQVREQAALLDIAHEAIQVRDLEGRIIYWNRGAEQTYGWTAAEVLGRKSSEILYHDSAPFLEALDALLTKGEWQGEVVKHTKDGRDIIVDARWTLVRDAHGSPKAVLAIDTDITEKKRLESQFLRAQRMEGIGTLAGGIAHDLNNTLAPILMSVDMLKELVREEEGLSLLTTLQGSAQRAANLVKQVLSFARGIEGQRITVNPLPLMRDLLEVMRDTFSKSIDLRFSAAGDLWTVTGDHTQIHQVFLNLCVNARDAMPEGGNLTIRMENVVLDETYAGMNADARPGSHVVVTVEDTGTGIPASIRDRIFEPFFTTKAVGKGTGLGLSTTVAIVKSHGGFINVYSEPGAGTRFQVYLPANTAQVAVDRGALDQARLPRGNGELILLVDDEEAIRNIARRTLERFGYRILLASNGAEAVALYAQYQSEVALVLTDMSMPVMDGPATIIALRAMNPAVRIIASSGLASGSGIARAVGVGVVHFVPKPYTAEAMLKTLRDVLSGDAGMESNGDDARLR